MRPVDEGDARAIEDVVRAFLETKGSDAAGLCTGPLAERIRLDYGAQGDGIQSFTVMLDEVILKRPVVDSIHRDEATASLDAVVGGKFKGISGAEGAGYWRLAGPVLLRRVGSDWRIADLRQDGRSMLGAMYRPYGLRSTIDGVEIGAIGMAVEARLIRPRLRPKRRRRAAPDPSRRGREAIPRPLSR